MTSGRAIPSLRTAPCLAGAQQVGVVRARLGDRDLLRPGPAFRNLYLTWNEEAQAFEDDLHRIYGSANGDVEALRAELDEVQARIDVASLNLEEWNVLYRLRLQLAQDVARRTSEES